jgi:hypothetical protein
MTTSPRTTALSIALVALLAAACVVTAGEAATAASLPRSVPLTAEFDDLRAGESASTSWDVDIPHAALITAASVRREGDDSVRWRATLCPAGGGSCVDLLGTPDGTPLAAGTYRLGVGVTMLALSAEPSQSIEGRVTFVERPAGSLAFTGSGSLVPLLLSAVAALAVGLLLFLAARRRRPADETEDLS